MPPAPSPARPAVRARLGEFFGLESDWVRPTPPIGAGDLWFGAAVALVGVVSLELTRSIGILTKVTVPGWVQWVAVLSGAALLIGRRRWPLTVALLGAAHMFVLGVTMPEVMSQVTLQVAYFIATFSAVAWARDRRIMLVVVTGIITFMFLWLAWQFAVGNALQDMLDETQSPARTGLLGVVPAAAALTFLINAIYFGGAVIGGQFAWRSARKSALLTEQALTIIGQSESLRRRAVVDERLRIARELHDVVGHHISVIGIQAAAARRVVATHPDAASTALSHIEQASRDGVTQMRSLLGTLRSMEEPTFEEATARTEPATEHHRAPEPGLADLSALAAAHSRGGLATAYEMICVDPAAAERISAPMGLCVYRVAQEALTNVGRHSTAREARVTVRVAAMAGRPQVEVEVVDDGRPRHGSSGSGMGQLGMRERIASLGGTIEIGPRPMGGYRVRARIPLGDNDV